MSTIRSRILLGVPTATGALLATYAVLIAVILRPTAICSTDRYCFESTNTIAQLIICAAACLAIGLLFGLKARKSGSITYAIFGSLLPVGCLLAVSALPA